MRYFSKFLLLVVISFVTNSCSMTRPHKCCGNIPASSKIDEPLFSDESGKDPKHWDHFTNEDGTFNPDRLKIVDKIGNNILVRSNLPVINDKFAYKELTETIDKNLYAKYKQHLSTNYLLIDISLLQLGQFSLEHNWFRKNPKAGCYWNRPVIGSLIDPDKVDRKAHLHLESMRLLNAFIVELHELVSMTCDRQVVVLVHCKGGHDRTGEIIGCYRMKYLGISYNEATAMNNKLTGPIHDINRKAMEWYALYLREVEGIKTVGDVNGK